MQLFSSPKSQFPLFSTFSSNPSTNPSVPRPLSKLPFAAFSPLTPLKIPPLSSGASPPPLQEKLLCPESDDDEPDEDQEQDDQDDDEADSGGEAMRLDERRETFSQGFLAVRRPMKEVLPEQGDDSSEDHDGRSGREDESEASSKLEMGLSDIARKMPIFEPERVGMVPGEKPLGINLELGLYRAKVLARSFRFEEAEKILRRVVQPFSLPS